MANTGALAGLSLGKYELRELLGRGGMGAVYRAYQHALKREVAVKVLSDQLTDEPGYLERFNAEARTAAALEHPHIVPIHDFGTQDDLSYVVMRYLTGGSLHERMRAAIDQGLGKASLAEIAELLAQVASALDYAHHEGVVHRDIKPQNIMFDNHGKAYVVDFGIAKLLHQTAMTMSGMALGSPSYMPPEQWRGEGISGASDQYALAVTIYALITGRLPFEGDSQQQLMYKHLSELPPPLSVSRPDLPPALTLVMNRALAKDSADRFPNCTQFSQAFAAAIEGVRGEVTNYFMFKLPKTERKPATMTARPADGSPATPAGSAASTPSRTPVSQPTIYPPPPVPAPKSNLRRNLILFGIGFALMAAAALVISNLDRTPGGDDATQTDVPGIALLTTETPTDSPTESASLTATSGPTSAPTDTATSEPTTEATMDALAIAQATRGALQTADAVAQQETTFQSTIAALQTSLSLEDQTATATLWTPPPTLTETATNTPADTETATATDTQTPTETPSATRTLLSFNQTATQRVQVFANVTATAAAFQSLEPTATQTLIPFDQTATRRAESFANVTASAVAFSTLSNVQLTGTKRAINAATSDAQFANLTATAAARDASLSAAFGVRLEGLRVSFTNNSTGQIASVLWEFGDGATSTRRSPFHTYGASGSYEVTLSIVNNAGVTDTTTQTVQLGEPEPAGLSAAFSVRHEGRRVVFTNTTSGQIASVLWDFGDGATSTLRSPFHTYAENGTYEVTLEVVNNAGETSQATESVEVGASQTGDAPVIDAYAVQSGARSVAFLFSYSGEVTEVEWHFGDDAHSEDFAPVHEYADLGTYEVTLDASGPGGETSVSETVVVAEGCELIPVDDAGVRIRAESSTSSQIVGTIDAGERVFTSRSVSGGLGLRWYQVYFDGAIGWVSSNAVRAVEGICPRP